ncbi:SurA N-terminal domain-containing protein [Roseibium litorale]|uniref:SurA N-terminal domain-containing protein n=1 Tax=Roseibium litorale TaxID=2803841 RepID=A0ABR9CPV5_9HYPH|nr:SurA N-terminal domain-containing protein [Roseibium litorale]MBD8892708.1 SurA N-terminal domain-containing protein [Roseibium litorale]
MRISLSTLSLALAIAAASPLAGTVATARAATIEVVVNDKAITTYEIQQRARLITLTQRKGGVLAKKLAEEELVNEVLQLAEATRVGVRVSQAEVDGAFANIARSVKLSPSQLAQALGQSGVKADTLKDRLRAQLAWVQTVRRRFQADVHINESDVIAALRKSDKADQATSMEYDLRQVIVVVPAKASGSFKSKRKSESDQIRKAFNGCDAAGPVLAKYSEVVMKPVGRRLETELPGNLKDDIEKTEPGRLTKPQQTGKGYEMIAVCSKRELQSDIAARTEVENELRAKEGEAMSRRYLMELRSRATIIER